MERFYAARQQLTSIYAVYNNPFANGRSIWRDDETTSALSRVFFRLQAKHLATNYIRDMVQMQSRTPAGWESIG